MRYLVVFALLSLGAKGEAPVAPPPAGGNMPAPQSPSSGNSGSNVIQPFDNGFFNTKAQPPSTVPADRYGAPEANYNSEQLERWKEICEPEKKKSMQDYRDCFQREKKKTLSQIKQGFDDVERKQAIPLSNVPPAVNEYKGLPGGNEKD